ncbi:hypothetical protein PCASD_18125 [Puccinia coronata f. sp. avenae]|uniref:Uncharacterized protein n=1 Tax=Puccinia coronata f. sp. avenae TaxID=200324 RepID=A0A2N5SQ18_9BASI|nr:hypothetical protein PCASD_18125 [Puccinia coronata f. sp. avenae]
MKPFHHLEITLNTLHTTHPKSSTKKKHEDAKVLLPNSKANHHDLDPPHCHLKRKDIETHGEDLYNRFRELHKRVPNYEVFLQKVEPEVLKKYVEDLEKLKDTLSTATDKRYSTSAHEFNEWWRKLLTRSLLFQDIVMLYDIKNDPELQQEVSRLAFFKQHPTLGSPIDHGRRVAALDAHSRLQAEALFASTP